ncbi:GMC oxidoreductase [Xylariaceae sp. FL0255]|nr:GMC oxidoreductase [Xylariaceae sp. FL0255]
MKSSFSSLALLSTIAPFAMALNQLADPPDQYGIDIAIDVLPAQNDFPQTSDLFLPNDGPQKDEYEYIVVGSGPGGSPLAANLAKAGHSVLLVEAGGDFGHMREVESPSLANPSSERLNVSWGFFVHHYADLEMALKDRKLTWLTPDAQYYSGLNPPEGSKMLGNFYPRYGGLGGCSEHNALVGLLPSKSDWDNIAATLGDDSWLNDNMRQYFEQMEKLEYPVNSTKGHGFDGYIDMSINPAAIAAQDIKLMSAIAGAAKGFGLDDSTLVSAISETVSTAQSNSVDPTSLIPLNMTEDITNAMNELFMWDANIDSPTRDTIDFFGYLPQTMDNVLYRRSSPRDLVYNTATAKNADGSKKYPLDVALLTLATKVTFDTTGKTPKANGIEYLYGQSLYRADPRASKTEDGGKAGSVKATKEVIISGGAYNSPQLLKLSGVGAKEELEQFNIPVVVDLPGVGENLQDRIETAVGADYPSNFTRIIECYYLALPGDNYTDPCWAQYADPNNQGAEKGIYASNGVVFGAFWPSSFSETGEQDLWVGGFPAQFNGFYPGYSVNAASTYRKNHWSWLVLKAHTRNTAGTVKLISSNPRDMPNITFHNLYEGLPAAEADKDVGAMIEGMKMAFSFFDNVPDVQGTPTRYWPPANVTTDEDLKEWIKQEAWGHHASCSNKIGADNDTMAVLDGQFRVRGTEGLRVVDASVFPHIPGTFPVVPIMMLSQKATADILGTS